MCLVNNIFNLYDANGNMTADLNKGVSLTYNRLNLPLQAVFPYRRSTAYVHGADGTKLRVTHSTGMLQSGGVPSVILLQPIVTTTDYCGNLLFENGELSRLLVDGGYVTFTNGTPHYHFHLKDHLGSSRVVFSETGVVEQETQYYPYGGIMADLSTGQDAQRHKYNGKELDRMHGLDWYDYGARHYDAVLGRWTTMDPLCEKYYNVSPYAYCMGSPISYYDEDGKRPKISKIIYNGNGLFSINISNLNSVSRRTYQRMNNDPYYWRSGEIGISPNIFKISIAYNSYSSNSDYSPIGIDESQKYVNVSNPIAKRTGMPDRRYKQRTISTVGINAKSTGFSYSMLALNAAIEVFDKYILYSFFNDLTDLEQQASSLRLAAMAVNDYASKGLLPSQFANDVDKLGNLINYVFQGKNDSNDKKIEIIGKEILKANGRYDEDSNMCETFIEK